MQQHIIKRRNIDAAKFRFDAGYHLSEGISVRRALALLPNKCLTINDVSSRIFYGIRANRTYVEKKDYAIPFLTGANIMLASLSNAKLVSKKHTPCVEEMTLHEGWVMVTRSGTIGQTAWANKNFDGKYGSEDIIRIVPNNRIKGGVIYAYLASKYGQSLLTQGAFGAVIQHIEPSFIGELLIPEFDIQLQEKVDMLVQETASLRYEATCAINEAHAIIENAITYTNSNVNKFSIKEINSSLNRRFEGAYYASDSRNVIDTILKKHPHNSIKELTTSVFKPNIFKRAYVKTGGYPLIGGADMMKAMPKTDKRISRKQVEALPDIKIDRNYILITRAGTIGNIAFADNQLKDMIVSEDVLRLVPKDENTAYYLYGILSSEIGQKLITRYTYGSVIQHIESQHIEEIPIPILDEEKTKLIIEHVRNSIKCIEEAKITELLSIQLIEQEIEKWNN